MPARTSKKVEILSQPAREKLFGPSMLNSNRAVFEVDYSSDKIIQLTKKDNHNNKRTLFIIVVVVKNGKTSS